MNISHQISYKKLFFFKVKLQHCFLFRGYVKAHLFLLRISQWEIRYATSVEAAFQHSCELYYSNPRRFILIKPKQNQETSHSSSHLTFTLLTVNSLKIQSTSQPVKLRAQSKPPSAQGNVTKAGFGFVHLRVGTCEGLFAF